MTQHRPRHAALSLLFMLVLLLTACGDPENDVAAEADGDNAEDTTTVDDEMIDHLVGLEVTAAGNVTEVVDDNAFRIDKDGLGEPTVEASEEDEIVGDIDDYDTEYFDRDTFYYDYEYGTAYDDEFGDTEVLEEGVLVMDLNQTDVALDEGVRVNGTLRRFEETTLEDVYDVDLNDDIYGPFEDHLVLVASNVTKVESPAGDAQSPAPSPSAAATMTPTEG